MPTSDHLLALVRAGGSIVISAKSLTHERRLALVQAAKGAGATVTIRDAGGMTSDQSLALARAGAGGTVVLDFVSA